MTHAFPDSPVDGTVGGVRDFRRLAAVAQAELEGHLGDPALNAIVATLRISCRVPIAVVNVVSEDRQTYPAEVGVGAPCTTVPDGVSFCAEVVDTKAPVMVVDATVHPTYAQNPLVRAGVIRSYAGFPLVDDGYVLGSVSIFDSERRVFTMDELAVLAHQARLASSVLALRRSVRTDPLTGIPNLRSLIDHISVALARAERQGDLVAVMCLDVDGFKTLTHDRGREAGDTVLATLARRWRGVMRPMDTLARIGGDEFVAVCGDLSSPDQAVLIADRLVKSASEPIPVGARPAGVGVSIGIALARDASRDAPAMLDAAAVVMQRAKDTGGSTWQMDGPGASA